MTFAAGSRGIYGWGRSGGSGCRRGGTFALIFAYNLAFVFAFAVSLPSVVTLVASASAPVWGFSFSFTFLQIRVRWVEVPYVSRGVDTGREARGRRTEGCSTRSTYWFNAWSWIPRRRSIPRLESRENRVRFAAWSSTAWRWIGGGARDVRSKIGRGRADGKRRRDRGGWRKWRGGRRRGGSCRRCRRRERRWGRLRNRLTWNGGYINPSAFRGSEIMYSLL